MLANINNTTSYIISYPLHALSHQVVVAGVGQDQDWILVLEPRNVKVGSVDPGAV